MKNQKLTHVEMNFISSLVNAGASPKEAFAMLYGNYAVENTTFHKESREKVVSKDTNPKDLVKSKSRPATHTATPKKSGEQPKSLKVGDYVKVLNIKTNEVVAVGKIAFKGKDKKTDDFEVVRFTKKSKISYKVDNCVKISKKDFGKLKKSLKGKVAVSKPTTKRLDIWYYTKAMALIADKSDKDLKLSEQVENTTINDEKKLREILNFIRELKLKETKYDYDKFVAVLKENKVGVFNTDALQAKANA